MGSWRTLRQNDFSSAQALGQEKLSDAHLNTAFERLWPHLEQTLKQVPLPQDEVKPLRTERDLLEESVTVLRYHLNLSGETPAKLL